MINYIYRPNSQLSKNQIKGIERYLNLSVVDLYFRVLNGHTQVNANEVYALPFPSLEQLESLGKDSSGPVSALNKNIMDLNGFHEKQSIELIHA